MTFFTKIGLLITILKKCSKIKIVWDTTSTKTIKVYTLTTIMWLLINKKEPKNGSLTYFNIFSQSDVFLLITVFCTIDFSKEPSFEIIITLVLARVIAV